MEIIMRDDNFFKHGNKYGSKPEFMNRYAWESDDTSLTNCRSDEYGFPEFASFYFTQALPMPRDNKAEGDKLSMEEFTLTEQRNAIGGAIGMALVAAEQLEALEPGRHNALVNAARTDLKLFARKMHKADGTEKEREIVKAADDFIEVIHEACNPSQEKATGAAR
jgi:hypothetical protein